MNQQEGKHKFWWTPRVTLGWTPLPPSPNPPFRAPTHKVSFCSYSILLPSLCSAFAKKCFDGELMGKCPCWHSHALSTSQAPRSDLRHPFRPTSTTFFLFQYCLGYILRVWEKYDACLYFHPAELHPCKQAATPSSTHFSPFNYFPQSVPFDRNLTQELENYS